MTIWCGHPAMLFQIKPTIFGLLQAQNPVRGTSHLFGLNFISHQHVDESRNVANRDIAIDIHIGADLATGALTQQNVDEC